MASAKQPDWEAIESAYRVGVLSVRAIAERNGLTDGAIRKRAKKEGWSRDLTEKVKLATSEKLASAPVRTDSPRTRLRTDDEIVDAASDEAAAVVISHRTGLSRWRAIADKLCMALTNLDIVEDNLGDFSRALNSGVDAQLKVIKGERQAYNLDVEAEVEGSRMEDVLRDLIARMPG